MMTKEGSNKIVNFITPRAGVFVLGCGQISHIVKMHYFFKNILYSHAFIRQTEYQVYTSNDDQGRIYKNCKFLDQWCRVSCGKAWPYKSCSENALFLLKYSQLLDID